MVPGFVFAGAFGSGTTDQITVVFGLFVTITENVLRCPPNIVMFFGDTLTLTGGTVTLAIPQVGAVHVTPQAVGVNMEQATIWSDC